MTKNGTKAAANIKNMYSLIAKEQYAKQRAEMMAAVKSLIGEGKTEEANAKIKEVEELDNKWEATKLANANLKSLEEKTKKLTDFLFQSGQDEVIEDIKEYCQIAHINKDLVLTQ